MLAIVAITNSNFICSSLILSDFNETMVALQRTIFLDGYYKAWSMGSGPCTMCKTCNVSGACVNSAFARPSMEFCAIDVFKTAREHGLPIKVLESKTEARQSYGLVLVE